MICPNCQKIIAEGRTGCPFCKAGFGQAPTAIPGENVAGAPQTPYAPQMQTEYAPLHPYVVLGGLLNFFVVIWKYLLLVYTAIEVFFTIIASIFAFAKLDDFSWKSLKPICSIAAAAAYLVLIAILYFIIAVKIEKRDASFLSFWQKTVVILSAASFCYGLVFTGVLYTALGLAVKILGILICNLYFTKSLRVRIYMGSDAYLRQSLFNKKTTAPEPERSKSEKTKLIILAISLIVIYEVIAGTTIFLVVKDVMPQIKAAFEVTQQSQIDYEDKTTGISFTIPKGLKENKELENEQAQLVLESAHTNFEYCAFTVQDLLEEVPEEEKAYINRSEIDNSVFTRQDIQERMTYNIPASNQVSGMKTTVERIGGYEYYVVSFDQVDQNGDTLKCINYVHFYNGYEIIFHYQTYFAQTSLKSVKEWISTVTIPGEAALPDEG